MCMKVSGRAARLQMIQDANDAQTARTQEDDRQARLQAASDKINKQFKQFGSDYYNKYRQAVLDYYNPDVDKQYNKTRQQAIFDYARAGTLGSSQANETFADLQNQYDVNKANVVAKADTATGTQKKAVGDQKNAVIAQLYSTENPNVAANTATNTVRTLANAAPDLSPIGELFKTIAIGGGGFYNAYNDPYARLTPGTSSPNAGRNVA